MILFVEIRPDEVQGIGNRIMTSTSFSLRGNQPYRKLNIVKALIHWCRCRHAMGNNLDSTLFREIDMNRCREELDMKEDSQPEISINKPDKFKPINWVQWSKEFENYVSQYKTARMTGVSLSYVTRNEAKCPNTSTMSQLPKSKSEYWDLTLDNRYRWYSEDSKRVYSLLEELMLGTDGYEWLGKIAMRNRKGT